MRLLHLTTIPATLGFLRGQPAALRRAGIEVTAISSPGPELLRFGRDEGIPVAPVEMARSIAPARDVVALVHLVRALRAARPTILDAHTPKAGLLGMVAAAIARVPVRVYHLHGLRFATARGWRRLLLATTERIACALAHRVLAVSPSLRAEAVAAGVCRPGKIRVLLGGSVNGVDAAGRFVPAGPAARAAARAALGIPEDARVAGFVGRLARDKGVAELAKAWEALRADPRRHLVLVGPVDETDPPPAGVLEALRADPRVHLTGGVPHDAVVRHYAALDVVALPTHREGFGQIALEAAALALPVVASRVTGCVDAVRHGVTGTLVPPGDAAALAAALGRYLEDAPLRAAHGAAGRRRALEQFTPAALTDALRDEYLALVGATTSPERQEVSEAGRPHVGPGVALGRP